MTVALVLGLALAIGVGCQSREDEAPTVGVQEEQAALPEIVQTAVAIAKEIEADPDSVEAVLERHGLDPDGFDDMMYQISVDPDLSKAYNAALE
jgi:hypothetical protein